MDRVLSLLIILCLVLVTWSGCGPSKPDAPTDLLTQVKERGYLIVGTKFDSPPFGFLDADGQLKGFEIDLAHELAKQLFGDPDAVRFIQVNTSTRIATLDSKQVDFVLATMTITPKRAEVVSFTRPYYKAAQGIMVKANSPFQTLGDIRDKRIAFVIGSTGETNLKTAIPTTILLGFKSTMEAFSAFNAGRAEAFSTDDSILYGFLHEHCGLRLLPEKISEEPYGIAFRKDKTSPSLQSEIQETLDTLSKNGFLKALQDRWNKPYPPANCAA